MGIKAFFLPALLVGTSAVVPAVGVQMLRSLPPPQTEAVASPPGYGDFGAPGNPYAPGARVGIVDRHPAGAFSDQQPYPAHLTEWDYNPSDLNGGSRGFAPAQLTVNQQLPSGH